MSIKAKYTLAYYVYALCGVCVYVCLSVSEMGVCVMIIVRICNLLLHFHSICRFCDIKLGLYIIIVSYVVCLSKWTCVHFDGNGSGMSATETNSEPNMKTIHIFVHASINKCSATALHSFIRRHNFRSFRFPLSLCMFIRRFESIISLQPLSLL